MALKFANWLSAMPGNAQELLDGSAQRKTPVHAAEFGLKVSVMAKGVMQALRSLVDGKALDIVKSVAEKGDGFEAWRRLWAEYRPHTAGRKATIQEAAWKTSPRTARIPAHGTTSGWSSSGKRRSPAANSSPTT